VNAGNLVGPTGVSDVSPEERIAMRRYVIAAALVALAVPTIAAAKGPASASI